MSARVLPVTEQEVRSGMDGVAASRSLVFERTIVDLQQSLRDPSAPLFVDMATPGVVDDTVRS